MSGCRVYVLKSERLPGKKRCTVDYNEVNMQAVIDLRKVYKDQFEKEHNTRLGFMSFFVKAAVVRSASLVSMHRLMVMILFIIVTSWVLQ